MTTPHDSEPTEHGGDDVTKGEKKRPETLADFMELDTFIGAVNSSEDVPGGADMSVDSSKKFAEGLLKQYRRQQAEFAKYLREKDQQQQ